MSTIESLEKRVDEARDRIPAGVETSKKQLQKSAEHLIEKTEDSLEDFIDLVRRHPGKALGLTLAAGFVVGTLSAASRRRFSASDQIKNLAGTGADAWERLRHGFEEAASALKDGVDDAVKKFS